MTNKRREMCLSKIALIKRFTKNTIIKNFGITEEEFDKLLKDGFIEESVADVCTNCFRTWNHEQEECEFCGEDENEKIDGYYKYK